MEKSSLIKLKKPFEITNSKCNLKNTQFPSKTCRLNVNKNVKAIQCDLCKYLVHIECNHVDYNDYKYFQGANNPWFCTTCCSAIFQFASLNNNCFLSAIYCDRFNKNSEKQVEAKRHLTTFKSIIKFSTSF